MSDKGFERFYKMSVEFVSDAKSMGDYILSRTFRGPGDTVDAAMHRAERLYGAPATWLHRLRYRSIKDMPVSVYAAIARAYETVKQASEQSYLAEREQAHARNSKLLGIADTLAGTKINRNQTEVSSLLAEQSAAPEEQRNLSGES